MVTKDQIAQMKAERATPNATLEYTIGGAVETHVITTREAEREYEIMMSERAMEDAQRSMQIEHAISRHEGQPTAFFNETSKQEMKP